MNGFKEILMRLIAWKESKWKNYQMLLYIIWEHTNKTFMCVYIYICIYVYYVYIHTHAYLYMIMHVIYI